MDKKQDAIALFRYGIISPVINASTTFSTGGQAQYFREMEQKIFDVPGIGRRSFKTDTFKNWLRDYRQHGFDGLKLKERSDKGKFKRIDENIETAIKTIIVDYNIVSCSQLYRLLIAHGYIQGHEFAEQTLREFIKFKGLLDKKDTPVPRKRYEKEHVNELWIGDFLHGLPINKRKTYLCAIIDDHSRVITGYGWYHNENSVSLEQTIKSAIMRFGIPKVFYCDNARIFINSNFQSSCARTGIALVHSRPRDPASRGKIERFMRTVRQMFLPMINFNDLSLDQLNDRFRDWVENEYHRNIHSSINESPMQRYLRDMETTAPRRVSEEDLGLWFYRTLKRRVNNDSTVSVNGIIYEAPSKYIGRFIEIRHASESPEELFLFEDDKPVFRLRKVKLSENADVSRTPVFSLLNQVEQKEEKKCIKHFTI